jgi:hypothetical protein
VKGLINSRKIAFFRPARLSGDTICTKGNPIKRGNYLPEIKGIAGSGWNPAFLHYFGASPQKKRV